MQTATTPLPFDELPCSEASDWLSTHAYRPVGPDVFTDGRRTIIRLAMPSGRCLLLAYPPPDVVADDPAY